jgi:catechol 2,3-dioxygenase-like lactoylglutathione lyase family enzyme
MSERALTRAFQGDALLNGSDYFEIPRQVQIAMCTASIARSVELFGQVFGFGEAMGEILTGEGLARMQQLGTNTACIGWWFVGRQDFLQVEFFQHQLPVQKPLRADWRPNDHGWVRWGFAVPDFDDVLARLSSYGLSTITPPRTFSDGVRRVALRDPCVGTVLEIMEDGPNVPGGLRPYHFQWKPAVIYSTVVVPSVSDARAFWTGALGLPEVAPNTVHTEEMEAIWGLANARREMMVVQAGDSYIEIVEYHDPTGRPHPEDYRLCDQGMMNVGLGFRERRSLDALVRRLVAAGYVITTPLGPDTGTPIGTYTSSRDGTSVEVLTILADYDPYFGFRPRAPSPVKTMLQGIKTS